MADFDCFTLVYALLLTANAVVGSERYSEYHLEEARICHPFGKKSGSLQLSGDPNAAVVVRPTYTFQYWQGVKMDKSCKFVFKASKGEHLFAVIQNMSLRGNDTHCLDYIKFKRKDKHETREFCGQIDRRKVTYRPMQEQSSEWQEGNDEQIRRDFAEFDLEGEIETTVFISKNPLEKDETLDLTIVYTPYKECSKIKTNREEYRSVTNYSLCMAKDYFCDGYQNCLSEICRDEENCERPYDIVSNGTGTKVTIGAVTTMLLCFVIFIMGLWICRRNKKMCWSSDCAGPGVHDNRLSRDERGVAGTARQSVAVDPMLEVATLPSVLDKDLPPSYDSLFPEQSNPSAT